MIIAPDLSESSRRNISNSTTSAAMIALGFVATGCASVPEPRAAQASAIVVRNADALLSEEPEQAAALEASVATFLTQARDGEFTADVVPPEELERYRFFFRRVIGFGDTAGIGTPSILKAYTLNGEDHFVTIAFSGEVDGVPFLDMIVELQATPHREGYRFHCPFEDRTKHFHSATIDDVCFRHSGDFDEERARLFVAKRAELARLSGLSLTPLEYFAFQSLDEMLKSYGLVFDEARCNFLGHDLASFDDGGRRYVTGMGDECYFYGFAGRFLRSPDHEPSQRYHLMAVGFQTLFGGYWLIGTPMAALRAELRETVRQTPGIDLVDLFKKGRNGQTQGHAPSLVMAALVCERALEKSGFDGMLRLVYSGKKGERFFEELDAVLGIDEAGFQDAIVEMLAGAQSISAPAR